MYVGRVMLKPIRTKEMKEDGKACRVTGLKVRIKGCLCPDRYIDIAAW